MWSFSAKTKRKFIVTNDVKYLIGKYEEIEEKKYFKKEKELTIELVTKIHMDRIELRILNVLPLLLQYNILKDGIPIFVRDDKERVDFETRVMNRFFELKPYIDEYHRMLSLKIKAGI